MTRWIELMQQWCLALARANPHYQDMKLVRSLRPVAAVLTGLCMTIAPAFAACPSLPDGPDSQNVTNGQERALCLQQELHDSTLQRNTQSQITGMQITIQQLQIQRRFDTLPVFTPAPAWVQ